MKRIHFAPKYFLEPPHPITINLVGCGGTGSQVINLLARFHCALNAMNHPGLHLYVYDPDEISEANIGRQAFAESEIGLNKATTIVTRINRFMGTAWEAVPELYTGKQNANIIITCVDTVKSRIEISKNIFHNNGSQPYEKKYYWLDFGNTRNTGQAFLGTIGKIEQPKWDQCETVPKLPTISQKYDLTKLKDEDSGPSCSLLAAIREQDILINPGIADMGCMLLWRLLQERKTSWSGVFLNLQTLKMSPVMV